MDTYVYQTVRPRTGRSMVHALASNVHAFAVGEHSPLCGARFTSPPAMHLDANVTCWNCAQRLASIGKTCWERN